MKTPLIERFEKKIELIPFTTCWIWTGNIKDNGYGQLIVNKKMKLAHRVSYELYKTTIPDKMEVCHSCDNRVCVNPSHLWLGTHRDNMKDMSLKGRTSGAKGIKHYSAKLTEEQVREIRDKYNIFKIKLSVLAKEYGVSDVNIFNIVKYKIWKHI